MRRTSVLAALLTLMLSVSCSGSGGPEPPARAPGAAADLVLLGGTVVTMDPDRTVIDGGGVAVLSAPQPRSRRSGAAIARCASAIATSSPPDW
jgi:hypothetical protein